MDTQQLKLMAGHVRAMMERFEQSIGHSQSLDLIAALPGLRNWPEVNAFPERVAATELDLTSTGRLSFRLKKRFGLDVPPSHLLATLALSPSLSSFAPQIWPAGPKPGVYVTTSQDAINALLEQYEEATDGALVYAERAGNRWNGSIDLGESGIWSSGLDRVPSGTLIVVGPLKLDQQSWESTAERLEMACIHALNSGHRVAVLLDTPQPDTLHDDVVLMVTTRPQYEDEDAALMGIVTRMGDLETLTPFANGWPKIETRATTAMLEALPTEAIAALTAALSERKNGLVVFGSSEVSEHAAIDMVAASLALTEHVGPAARIMARHRSTPSKDWDVPEAIKELPFLPSLESAFARGYRRLIVQPSYTRSEAFHTYSDDTMLICGAYGGDVIDAFSRVSQYTGIQEHAELLRRTVAVLAVKPIPKSGAVTDLWISGEAIPMGINKYEEIEKILDEKRIVRWEDQLTALLDRGETTPDALKELTSRNEAIKSFLAKYSRVRKQASH